MVLSVKRKTIWLCVFSVRVGDIQVSSCCASFVRNKQAGPNTWRLPHRSTKAMAESPDTVGVVGAGAGAGAGADGGRGRLGLVASGATPQLVSTVSGRRWSGCWARCARWDMRCLCGGAARPGLNVRHRLNQCLHGLSRSGEPVLAVEPLAQCGKPGSAKSAGSSGRRPGGAGGVRFFDGLSITCVPALRGST